MNGHHSSFCHLGAAEVFPGPAPELTGVMEYLPLTHTLFEIHSQHTNGSTLHPFISLILYFGISLILTM